MEAVAQAQDEQGQREQPDRLLVNGLFGAVWQAVLDRSEAASFPAAALPGIPPTSGSGAHP